MDIEKIRFKMQRGPGSGRERCESDGEKSRKKR
jgi:hypothetical protein